MRTFEERKEEILLRSQVRIAKRRKTVYRVILSCVPVVLCISLASAWLLSGFGRLDNAAPESAMDPNCAVQDFAESAQAPEDVKYGAAMCPVSIQVQIDDRTVTVTDPALLQLFPGVETEFEATQDMVPEIVQESTGTFTCPGTADIIEGDPYPVAFTYTDGTTVWFTLRGNQLTRADGKEQYLLTEEQAAALYASVRPDHYEEVIELCVGRKNRYFSYNQKYIVDAFLEILEGESYGPVEEDRIRAEKYFNSLDPAKEELLEDDEYTVTLLYPGNINVDFILRGDRLTRADGVSYHLTQEQATLLHNMAEDNWEWDAPVLSEEQIIDVVKNEVCNYYAVTAEQDPQSGDWTLTFWFSQDCESYDMFIVSRKGKILHRQICLPSDEWDESVRLPTG